MRDGAAFVSVWRVTVGDASALWVGVMLLDVLSVWLCVGEMLFVDDKTSPVGVWRDNVRDTVLICVRE